MERRRFAPTDPSEEGLPLNCCPLSGREVDRRTVKSGQTLVCLSGFIPPEA